MPPVGANDPIHFDSDVPDWYQNSSSRRKQKIAEDRDAERSFDELAEKISEKISSSLEKIDQDSQKKILESQSPKSNQDSPLHPTSLKPKAKPQPFRPQPCTKTARKSTLSARPSMLDSKNPFLLSIQGSETPNPTKPKTTPEPPKPTSKSILKKGKKIANVFEAESQRCLPNRLSGCDNDTE